MVSAPRAHHDAMQMLSRITRHVSACRRSKVKLNSRWRETESSLINSSRQKPAEKVCMRDTEASGEHVHAAKHGETQQDAAGRREATNERPHMC